MASTTSVTLKLSLTSHLYSLATNISASFRVSKVEDEDDNDLSEPMMSG